MIPGLRLQNFKCFLDQQLLFRPLNLLTGLNGSGKSSVLQAILLLRQSYVQGHLEKGRLNLNGDLVRLGTSSDVLYSEAEKDEVIIGLVAKNGNRAQDLQFQCDRSTDFLFVEKALQAHMLDVLMLWKSQFRPSLFGDSFQYISAGRIGPQTQFPMSEYGVRDLGRLGSRGEYTSYFLANFGNDRSPNSGAYHPEAVADTIFAQTEAWLGEISPGTRLNITAHSSMDVVQLRYRFATTKDVTDDFRPTNVGFGLTYVLPVIVAVLSAKPGTLVLIENPEAHLHPRGQRRMGEFLAMAAAGGVQVVVETHSDHVLNGVRLAVRDELIPPGDVALHHFQHSGTTREVVSPQVDKNGRIDPWPDGFFDEWDIALGRLMMPKGKGSGDGSRP